MYDPTEDAELTEMEQLILFVLEHGMDEARTLVAQGFVGVAEIDHDLRAWGSELVTSETKLWAKGELWKLDLKDLRDEAHFATFYVAPNKESLEV